jgi:hypothetical protein
MHQHLRLLAGPLATVSVAAMIAGCTTSHATTAREGTETFVLRTDSAASNPDFSVTASGLFSATGTFPGIGNGQNQSLAKFPDGTFVVTHPVKDQKTTYQSVDSKTCKATFDQKGTFTVAKGTGAYKGITGYGTDTAHFTGTLPRDHDGKCDESQNAVPVKGSTHTVITAKGSVLLPPR